MEETRLESDSIGTLEIPVDAYYGVQTLRGKMNFPITGHPMHPAFVKNIAQIKIAAAQTNRESGELDAAIADAVIRACREIVNGELREAFIVDAIQGGAGTSANMNMNEVAANRAIELMGGKKGDYSVVHPNDHVNMCQSTNDVIPTAGKLTALELLEPLKDALRELEVELLSKAVEFRDVMKMGRTQLEDAVPMRLGQSFHAYATMIRRDRKRLAQTAEEMKIINLGATAIGTGINTSPYYQANIVDALTKLTGIDLVKAEDLFDATENLDGFVALSGALKACAINLSKMCNDLRLLSSGPKTGFGEINLPPMQNGSSIMPGKVNPVIPEVVTQVAYNIVGNDTAIAMAAEAGQMELNAFEPVIFYNLFESLDTLEAAVRTLTKNCIRGITANRERCRDLLESSVGIVTAVCPYIGYKKAAEAAKESLETGVPVRKILRDRNLMSDELIDRILDPARLA
ncbi:MAG: aspartate ammonia-lyase [Lachnospiraceae bacterium]|nr:aspartate ammonia-lyase [Lachnospiraceae bacterium]